MNQEYTTRNNYISVNQPFYSIVPQNNVHNANNTVPTTNYQQPIVNAQLIQQHVNNMNCLNNIYLNLMVNQTQYLISDLNHYNINYSPLKYQPQTQQQQQQQQNNGKIQTQSPPKPLIQPIKPIRSFIQDDIDNYSNSSNSSNTGISNINNSIGYNNVTTRKKMKFLRWIIYHDQIDDYADMLCSNDLELQIYVINQCAKHSATHAACVKWSKKWNLVNHTECINSIHYVMNMNAQNKFKNKINNIHKKKDFIDGFDNLLPYEYNNNNNNKFNILNDILFVNNKLTFLEAKKILLSETKIIGLDLECTVKQFPIDSPPKMCQILQIATRHKTIIFDLESIPSKYSQINNKNNINLYVSEFEELLYKIFYNPSIIKIGMGFNQDLKLLRKQYPYLKCFKCIIKSYFELEKLLNFIRSKTGKYIFNIDTIKESLVKTKLNKTNLKREGGLVTITRHILNKKLNKKEQLSNWARRPLRLQQLKYAAIDAKIQIDIYYVLINQYNTINVDKFTSDLSMF